MNTVKLVLFSAVLAIVSLSDEQLCGWFDIITHYLLIVWVLFYQACSLPPEI